MNNFFKGLLFGSGFGLGLVIIALVIAFFLYLSPIKFGDSDRSIVGTDALIIENHRIDFNDHKPTIYGTLVNSTDKTISSVIVEGSVFNQDDCFINKNDEYFNTILPNDTIGFKITFYDWENNTKEENLTYKVRIKQGFDR